MNSHCKIFSHNKNKEGRGGGEGGVEFIIVGGAWATRGVVSAKVGDRRATRSPRQSPKAAGGKCCGCGGKVLRACVTARGSRRPRVTNSF